MQELLQQSVLQHDSCLFWAFCPRVLSKWIYWKRHLQELVILRNRKAVTCHNQMVFRKIPSKNIIFFFSSVLKADLITQLFCAEHSAVFPSEEFLFFTRLLLLTDLICFSLKLLERLPSLAGRCQQKTGEWVEFLIGLKRPRNMPNYVRAIQFLFCFTFCEVQPAALKPLGILMQQK